MMADAFGLAIGDAVTVTTLSNRSYAGTVAWSVAPFTGMAFKHPIKEDDPLFKPSRTVGDRDG